MIDARELRIGNWVINKHNETQQIFNINDDGMRIHHKPTVSINCEPIPLTTEILGKCGFELAYEGADYFVHELMYGTLNIEDKECFCLYDYEDGKVTDTSIKYLHQLQNLYFCLTGKEIEIKL